MSISARCLQQAAAIFSCGFTVLCLGCADTPAIGPQDQLAKSRLPGAIILSSGSGNPNGSTLSIAGQAVASRTDTVYASMPPGTLPTVSTLTIQNVSENFPAVTVEVVEGGFDPVPIPAAEGDSLRLIPKATGEVSDPVIIKVPAKRPPAVVRSNPPKGRTDVALNVLITVVFTEPVRGPTVNSNSVKVFSNGTAIPGTLVLHNEPWVVDFVPDSSLAARTPYELVVTGEVMDRDGEALAPTYSAQFITGDSLCADSQTGCQRDSPIAGNNTITGIVTQLTTGEAQPIPGAEVSAWIELPDQTGYKISGIITDADGRYTIGSLPNAVVSIGVSRPGLEQHCAATIQTEFSSRTTADIRLSVPGDFRDVQSRLPSRTVMEGYTRLFYGWDSDNPYGPAILGARVSYQIMDVVLVSAVTGEDGYFAFCKVPSSTLRVEKAGYESIAAYMDNPGGITLYVGMTAAR